MKVDITGMNEGTPATVGAGVGVESTPAASAVRSAVTPANIPVAGRPATDTVTVSDTASRLSVAVRAMAPPPETNTARVDALHHAVHTGSLAIDIVSLANDIMNEEGKP